MTSASLARIILLLCTIQLCSCWANPLGLYDEETCPTFHTKPSETLVIGTYELDSASLNYIRSLGLSDSLTYQLTLDSAGRATCENFPIAKASRFDLDTLVPLSSTWSYALSQGSWNQIEVDLDSLGYRTAHLCSKNGQTSLFFTVGDPDAQKGARYNRVAVD